MGGSGDITRLRNQELLRELAAFHGDVRSEFEDQVESMGFLLQLRRLETPHGLGVISPRVLRGGDGTWNPNGRALDALIANREFAATLALRTMLEVNRAYLYRRLDSAIARILHIVDQDPAVRAR